MSLGNGKVKQLFLVKVKSKKYGWKRNILWYETQKEAEACIEGYEDIGIPRENLALEEYWSSKAEEKS